MKICSVPGCGRKHRARGFCKAHWQRWSHGEVHPEIAIGEKRGALHSSWRGVNHSKGRVLIHAPGHPYAHARGSYVLRSRLVMEKHLGRFLELGEVVHHINGDKLDDRIENLQVMSPAIHARVHNLDRARNSIGWWA